MYGIEIEPWIDEQQLVDETVITTLINATDLSADETVIEIGPGTGNITAPLLETSGKVIAVEMNLKYKPVLKGRFGNNPKLEIVIEDILYYRFPRHDRLISNLPYMITEPLFHLLFKLNFKSAAFIVPLSFAERINVAEPMSKLGYLSQVMFETEFIEEVYPSSYLPPPKTQTAIVTIKPRTPETEQERVLQTVFWQEDKKTSNALREALIQTNQVETKRLAKQAITKLEIPKAILETPVTRLSFDQLKELSNLLQL